MTKPQVVESRYDFRGGRNTAISPDLLNPNELVDCTNARLSASYGGFTKRTGSQRIHQTAFPASVQGVTQWDGPSGKQTVVISNGALYYRNGLNFAPAFSSISPPAGTSRTTLNQGLGAHYGWNDPDGTADGRNIVNFAFANDSGSVAAGSRLYNTVGDPGVGNNLPSSDDTYTLTFIVSATAAIASGGGTQSVDANVDIEASIDNGGTYTTVSGGYTISASRGGAGVTTVNKTYTVTVSKAGAPGTGFRIRLALSGSCSGTSTDPASDISVKIFNATNWSTDPFPVTWSTGGAKFSLTQPSFFAPFRSATSAALILYIASGGHYFAWDGIGTLTQLDGTNSAPVATNIISYHTRMFAMTTSQQLPGITPKTIFWSVLGDATDFRTGDKTKGGSAVTDFLTGQQLTALEVIGSSLLMATSDSVMRFTGHASDDIVISQDTEGVSAEVGAVSAQALKRFENVAAMLSDRGPYVVTETNVQPMGEQLNSDWNSLDTANLSKSSIEYNRQRKELLFAVPGATDGGVPKTIFSQSVRLQAWQGPWIYPFTINCMGKYFDSNNLPNVIAGSTDGFVRLMDIGNLDDVLFDGSGGSNITMTVEIPVLHFGLPGLKKALKWIILQTSLPIGSSLQIKIAFDGSSLTSFPVVPNDTGEEDYRVDIAGDSSQGFRARVQFVESTAFNVTVNGFTIVGYNYQRTT